MSSARIKKSQPKHTHIDMNGIMEERRKQEENHVKAV